MNWPLHGAFPVWSAARGTLYWADTLAPALRAFDANRPDAAPAEPSGADRIVCRLDAPICDMQLRPEGLLIAQEGRHLILAADETLTVH